MKKILLLVIASSLFSFSFAQELCKDFTVWKLCIKLVNNYDWAYSISKILTLAKPIELLDMTCDLTTPEWKSKHIWFCSISSTTKVVWKKDIKITASLATERKAFNFEHNFISLTKDEQKKVDKILVAFPKILQALLVKYPKLKTNTIWKAQAKLEYNWVKNLNNLEWGKYNTYKQLNDWLSSFIKYSKNLWK